MRKPLTVALFLVMPLVLLSFAGASQALTLYDNFSKKPIDPAKWSGFENSRGYASPNTEAVRKLAGGKLYIALTSYGRTDSNTGTPAFQEDGLEPTNPAAITTIQADVTIKSVTTVGCAANTTATRSRARVAGGFFNDGTSTGAGDRTGDIIAGIQSYRDTILGDQINAFISRCTNANCTTSTTLTFAIFTAKWTQGVPDTLGIQWLASPTKQFVFTLNPSGPSPETKTLSYTVSDTSPPIANFRVLSTGNTAANCMGPAPRGTAIMKALFDNVMVNP